jgi:hypothetical protein
MWVVLHYGDGRLLRFSAQEFQQSATTAAGMDGLKKKLLH